MDSGCGGKRRVGRCIPLCSSLLPPVAARLPDWARKNSSSHVSATAQPPVVSRASRAASRPGVPQRAERCPGRADVVYPPYGAAAIRFKTSDDGERVNRTLREVVPTERHSEGDRETPGRAGASGACLEVCGVSVQHAEYQAGPRECGQEAQGARMSTQTTACGRTSLPP